MYQTAIASKVKNWAKSYGTCFLLSSLYHQTLEGTREEIALALNEEIALALNEEIALALKGPKSMFNLLILQLV